LTAVKEVDRRCALVPRQGREEQTLIGGMTVAQLGRSNGTQDGAVGATSRAVRAPGICDRPAGAGAA
jgi:hypothetical protein